MNLSRTARDFYIRPGVMTGLGAHAASLEAVRGDIAGVSEMVQGVLMHHFWADAYKVALSPERRAQQHLRSASSTLDAVAAIDGRPVTERRELGDRAAGVCRHFTVVAVAMLRARGVPARGRVGFGAYFERGKFVDHWVVEYWNETASRWTLADAQLDELQRSVLKPDFDVLDVPRDRFIIAGDAWRQCRAGKADPMKFGILDMWGLWFIAHNVLLDFAALNKVEMLPWDDWGPMIPPGEAPTADQLALFDRLADLTLDADARFDELRALYATGPGLKVPPEVFNAVTNQVDRVAELADAAAATTA